MIFLMKKYAYSILFSLLLLTFAVSCNSDSDDAVLTAAPELVSIIPVKGVSGGTAIISGNHFSATASDNTVTVGGQSAVVTEAAKDRLTITLPQHNDGETEVVVSVNGKEAAGLTFMYVTLLEPEVKISGVTPSSAFAGDEVTIYGENFSDEVADMSVAFDGVKASVVSTSANVLKVIAPDHERGSVIIEVTNGAKKASVSFTYVELMITKNNPTEGGNGTIVTISGEGFSETLADNSVLVNGTAVELKTSTLTTLEVVMPSLPTGTYQFTVKVKGKETTGGSFTVAPLWYVETVAGNAVASCIDGIGTKAGLGIMQDICAAPDGMLWMTQRGGAGKDAIRMMNPSTYEVTTVVGTDDKTISGSHVWAGAFDSKGNYYAAGKAKGQVFKVGTDKTISVLALPAHNLTTNPMCVLLDAQDNLYLLNRDAGTAAKPSYISIYDKNLKLLKDIPVELFAERMAWNKDKTKILIGTTGAPFGLHLFDPATQKVTRLAGTGDAKPTAATFTDGESGQPLTATVGVIEGIAAAADGTIYFSDVTTFTVRKLVPDESGDYAKGTVKTVAGTSFKPMIPGEDGLALNANFKYPCGLLIKADGSVLVADGTGYVIRRIYQK